MNYGKRSTSKKQKSMHSKSAKAGKKASVIFIKAFLVCLLAAGVIGLCAGIGIVKGVIDNAPDIDSTSVIPRGYKSVMVDSDGNKMAELITAGSNRVWVDIDNIPEHVQKAFVDVEDERFYKHNGIDLKGIIRAGMKGIASGFRKTEGASTITQQLLKNSVFDFMSEDTLVEKIERKLQEQYLFLVRHKIESAEELVSVLDNLTDKKKEASKEKSKTYKAKERFKDIFDKAEQIRELDDAESCYQSGDTFFEDEHNAWERLNTELLAQGYSVEEVESLRKKYESKYAQDCKAERAVSKELNLGRSIWKELTVSASAEEKQYDKETIRDRKEQPVR